MPTHDSRDSRESRDSHHVVFDIDADSGDELTFIPKNTDSKDAIAALPKKSGKRQNKKKRSKKRELKDQTSMVDDKDGKDGSQTPPQQTYTSKVIIKYMCFPMDFFHLIKSKFTLKEGQQPVPDQQSTTCTLDDWLQMDVPMTKAQLLNTNFLSVAAVVGHEGAVQHLLQLSIDVNQIVFDRTKYTPLHYAVHFNRVQVTRLLLAHPHVNVNKKGLISPLDVAIYKNHIDIALMLLEHPKIQVNVATGLPPLYLAVELKRDCLIEPLVSCSANLEYRDSDGQTALLVACYLGVSNCVSPLLACGSAINVKNRKGLTPLMCACANGSREIVDKLLSHARQQVNLHDTDKNGDTALHHAAMMGQPKIVKTLVAHGADINHASNLLVETPLHVTFGKVTSIGNNKTAAAICLLALGADVNAVTVKGETPLHYACRSNDATLVQLLLSKHARQLSDNSGNTPVDNAREFPLILAMLNAAL